MKGTLSFVVLNVALYTLKGNFFNVYLLRERERERARASAHTCALLSRGGAERDEAREPKPRVRP